jgi:uncharacterized membrane protein
LPLGIITLLILPGYAMATALFARAPDLDGFERAALAVGLSVAQVPLLVLAIDRTPWGLSPAALAVGLGVLTCLWCAVAAVQLHRAPAAERYSPAARLPWPPSAVRWREWPAALSRLERLERLAVLVSLALVGLVGCSLLRVSTQPALPPTTEFYMLGRGGLAEDFPRAAAPGESIEVALGVANREGRRLDYRAVARRGGADLGPPLPIGVEAGATWTGRLTFALPAYGFDQRVEIALWRDGDAEPYRRLQLVVDVPLPAAPTPVRALQTPVP